MQNEGQRSRRRGWRLGTKGGSFVEYVMLVGVVALAAIWGFRQARARENHVIAQQARIIRTLDPANPGQPDWTDPDFGDDWTKPVCNEFGFCTVPGQCFAAGTPVATENGRAPIESIREGDLVWSRDEKTGAIALEPVTRRFVTQNQPVIELPIAASDGGETLRVTNGHPFWVTGQGWVPAADLAVNQDLWSASGEPLHVAVPANTELRYETVYNFEIAEYHTYFVGHHGMWVHNGGPSAAGPPIGPCKKPGAPGTIDYARGKGIPLGGSYADINKARQKDNDLNQPPNPRIGGEVHHVPAKDIWNKWQPPPPPFDKNSGPAIWLEAADHRATKSNGGTPGANEYRAKQEQLVKEGKLCEAIQMDIDDVRDIALKSGNPGKYEDGIRQMMDYTYKKAAELGIACSLH